MQDYEFIMRWAGRFGVQCALHVGAGVPVWHIDTGDLVMEPPPALTKECAQQIHAAVQQVLETHQPGYDMVRLLLVYATRLQAVGDARGSAYIRRLASAVEAANAGAGAAIFGVGATGEDWLYE